MLNERYLWHSSPSKLPGPADRLVRVGPGVSVMSRRPPNGGANHPLVFVRIRAEEALLRAHFGDEHTAYLTCEVIGVFAQSGQAKLVFDTRFYGDE
jgi:hypothetical protein